MTEDFIKHHLARACFDEIKDLRQEYEGYSTRMITMIEQGDIGTREFFYNEKKMKSLQEKITTVMSEGFIPDRFWSSLISDVASSLSSIGGMKMNDISIFIPSNLSEKRTRVRSEQVKSNVGGRPPHMRIWIDDKEFTKSEFAKHFDPAYSIAPETSRRMKWDTVEKLAAELVAKGKCYKVRMQKLDEYGEFRDHVTIGGNE